MLIRTMLEVVVGGNADYHGYTGLAFQLVDDVLEFTGTSSSLGKGSVSDIRHTCVQQMESSRIRLTRHEESKPHSAEGAPESLGDDNADEPVSESLHPDTLLLELEEEAEELDLNSEPDRDPTPVGLARGFRRPYAETKSSPLNM
ncbi:solanesyl diphosphate synthase 1, mitochondrial-like protein isoform X3 [Tanacetum coccineum]|uniref:Solanesyl diphosphate synthase 1, mitochondrial-like protein isoform X3 n=1 Tax=Tanacetum coccineum TaxID=301880 RepID=A0ABQ4YHT1_9ASTR